MGMTEMNASKTTGPRSGVWKAGGLAILSAVIANLTTRTLILGFWQPPASFLLMQMGAVALTTALFVLLAVAAYALLNRLSSRPNRVFTVVAFIALALSMAPNLLFSQDPGLAPVSGGTPRAFLLPILFHIIAAGFSIGVLTRFTRPSAGSED